MSETIFVFENRLGKHVDFRKCVFEVDPGFQSTLFFREDKDDFYFKVDIILNYFEFNNKTLRHSHFLDLVKEATVKKKAIELEKIEQEKVKLEAEKVKLEAVKLAQMEEIVNEVVKVLSKNYVNLNLVKK